MKTGWLRAIALAAVLTAPLGARAAEALPPAEDPVLEARILRVAAGLRCLVCQNQSVAESQADLAVQMRGLMRQMARARQTDEQIVDFMVQRYGEFVLLRPRFQFTTALLWIGPFLLIAGAAGGLLVYLSHRSRRAGEPKLTEEERRRAAALLAAQEPEGNSR